MKNGYTPEEQERLRAFADSNDLAKRLAKQPMQNMAGLMKRLTDLTEYLKRLEQGVISLANNMQMLGVEANISRLSHGMVYKILIEKKIMTEEEVKAMYEVEVSAKIREHLEEMQKQAGVGQVPPVPEPETKPVEEAKPEELVSDVVLPSESNPVVVFDDKGVKPTE